MIHVHRDPKPRGIHLFANFHRLVHPLEEGSDLRAPAIRCAPSSGYRWSVPVNPAGLAKHYLAPALAALGFVSCRWHDLRHAFAVMSLSAGEHYMAVSKMLGHASYVTTLTVYADYITESDGGKAAPLRRPVASSAANVLPMRRPPAG